MGEGEAPAEPQRSRHVNLAARQEARPPRGSAQSVTHPQKTPRILSRTRGDIVLPTVGSDGRAGKTVRVRCVTTPDKAQRVLLNRLGLTLPQRLKYMEDALQM